MRHVSRYFATNRALRRRVAVLEAIRDAEMKAAIRDAMESIAPRGTQTVRRHLTVVA